MNYITDGTFWTVALVLAVAIGIVWYNLKEANRKTAEDIRNLRATLRDACKELADASAIEFQESNEEFARIYKTLDDIQKSTRKTKKTH